MKATIKTLTNNYTVIEGRTAKSLSRKLRKKRVDISEIDIILLSLREGYTFLKGTENRKCKYNNVHLNISM